VQTFSYHSLNYTVENYIYHLGIASNLEMI
jgi:hypothetical protein